MLIYVDMTWPPDLGRTIEMFSYQWFPYGGFSNIENSYRTAWVILPLTLSYIVGFSAEFYLKALFIGTFALAGIAMYVLAQYIMGKIDTAKNKLSLAICATISAVVYMYNPWSIGHLWTYFFYPTYALLPLIFLFIMRFFDRPKLSTLLILVILMSLGTTSPHGIIWMASLAISYAIYIIITERKKLGLTLKSIVAGISLYIVGNMYWILPYTYSTSIRNIAPQHAITLSSQLLDFLSKNNGVLNGLRLISGWGYPITPIYLNQIWLVSGFILPIFAYAAVFLYKNRIVIYLAILATIALFLSMGTNSIFPSAYKWLVFESPISASLGWVFRTPDRWLVFVALSFSVLFGLSLHRIISSLFQKRVRQRVFAITTFSSITALMLFSFYPTAEYYSKFVYNPTEIPKDYKELNSWLSNQGDKNNFTVLWLPIYGPGGYYTSWSSNENEEPYNDDFWSPIEPPSIQKRIGPVNIWSSAKSINSFNFLFDSNSYPYELEKALKENRIDSFERLLMPLGVKYVIVDSSIEGSEGLVNSLGKSKNLTLRFKTDFLYVYENLKSIGPVYALSETQNKELTIITMAELNKPLEETSIDQLHENLVANPSFELKRNQNLDAPASWLPPEDQNFSVETDNETFWEGGTSLKIEAKSSTPNQIAWVKGSQIPVTSGQTYLIETHMKWENVEWSHMVIYGYDESKHDERQILQNPTIQSGTSEWQEWISIITIPRNITHITPYLAGGWKQDPSLDRGVTWFDKIGVYRVDPDFINSPTGIRIISYEATNPTSYTVYVNSTRPFVLALAEAYDPLWVAYVNGEEIRSTPMYDVINGFHISHNGSLKIDIRYEPQQWRDHGLLISSIVFAIFISYISYVWLRGNAILRPREYTPKSDTVH